MQLRSFKPASKSYRKADSEGLFIEVRPTGSKLWRMAYRVEGKQKLLSFGAYPAVSLALARQKRAEAKAVLAEGNDPMAEARQAVAARAAQTEHTFAKIAAEFIDKRRSEGRAKVTLTKKDWLLSIANEDLGD